MRSAVLGFGGAVVAVVFGLAAANPPSDSAVVVVPSVPQWSGPRQHAVRISPSQLYRTWIGEACTVSASGSAKTSSSVPSSAAPCANGATLTVSGVASGVMTGTGPWTFSALVPGSGSGMCAYFITVNCTDGVLTAEGALTGNALIECAFPAYGAVDIVSHDPIMIEINFPALAVGCGCAGGTVTISE